MEKALVVLSGGLDSTICLYWAINRFGVDNVHAVTYDYGQRQYLEIKAAEKVARMAGIELRHAVKNAGGLLASTSPLIFGSEDTPQYENYEAMVAEVGERIEPTFIPMRNVLLLTLATNYALSIGCSHIVIGVNQNDTANYPDCTEYFMLCYAEMANVAVNGEAEYKSQKAPIKYVVPLMRHTKAEYIKMAYDELPGCYEALAYTHTSYECEFPPVSKNHANLLRAKSFEDADLPDPLILRAVGLGLMEIPLTPNYDAALLDKALGIK